MKTSAQKTLRIDEFGRIDGGGKVTGELWEGGAIEIARESSRRRAVVRERHTVHGQQADRQPGAGFSRDCDYVVDLVSQKEYEAYRWARTEQGFTGTLAEWIDQEESQRASYEDGAAGRPTA